MSRTVMVWTAVAALPHASTALQVRVMTKFWRQDPWVMTSVKVMVGVLQLSVAVAVPVALGVVGALHSTCRSTGKGKVSERTRIQRACKV